MNIQSPPLLTDDDFLRWNEGREGKREFVRGRVLELTGGSLQHAELFLNLALWLKHTVADPELCVTVAEFGVHTPAGIRYPDVLLHRRSGNGKSLATNAPLFIAEILSPSSIAIDLGEKAAEYTAIPSLLNYLVLSQDEPLAWLWSREHDVFAQPDMLAGAESILTLPAFDVSLPLANLYRGIVQA